MSFLTFKGGVHPPEKKLSENQSIKRLPLPQTVFMYTSNNLGAPSKIIVSVGDKVKTGQLIAQANGLISANLHSSVTGEVVEIKKLVNSATGMNDDVVVINRDGEEEWELLEHSENFLSMSSEQIVDTVKQAGIVGLGGAMFPAHVKMMIPKDKKAEILIINTAECEPYITIDDRIMIEYSEKIITGIRIIMHATGARKAFIGIEDNKPSSYECMKNAAKDYPIEIARLKTKYPQGAEKQLIYGVTKREVPSGKLPIDVGCVVFNVSTVYAVYDAVVNGRPLVERGISLTGEGVKNPGNFIFRIGTKVSELLDYVGLIEEDKIDRIIYGGPMMGIPLSNVELPTFKGNNAITVLTKDVVDSRQVKPCIRCSRCVHVCPMFLQPYLLKHLSDSRQYDTAIENGLMDCMECGCCSYTCPSDIDLVKSFKTAKKVIRAMKQRRP